MTAYSDIEKCAKLMGLNIIKEHGEGLLVERGVFHQPFNPLTNAQDMVDLQCELRIDVECFQRCVAANFSEISVRKLMFFSDHPSKQSALAAAVVAVAVQIYDARFGGE